MADQLPPEWAIERAHTAIMGYDHDSDLGVCSLSEAKERVRHLPGIRALAEYIAEHEEAPVDPLLIKAREIVASRNNHQGLEDYVEGVKRGAHDKGLEMSIALAGIRCGIELGKAPA